MSPHLNSKLMTFACVTITLCSVLDLALLVLPPDQTPVVNVARGLAAIVGLIGVIFAVLQFNPIRAQLMYSPAIKAILLLVGGYTALTTFAPESSLPSAHTLQIVEGTFWALFGVALWVLWKNLIAQPTPPAS